MSGKLADPPRNVSAIVFDEDGSIFAFLFGRPIINWLRRIQKKGQPIRDDGPLPDTLMDLYEAQAAYAKAIKDADMIVMLSSMLHAIGTGNMTLAASMAIHATPIYSPAVRKTSRRLSSRINFIIGAPTPCGTERFWIAEV